MPNAFDPALLGGLQLPLDRNPLQRISYQPPKVEFDLTALIEDVKRYITELLFPAIEQLTGVDLSAFLPIINTVVDSLTTLFGDLNPSSGTFNPLDAVTTFIELMVEVGANLPMALIEELAGFSGGVPILSQLIGLFSGTTGGLTGLSGLGSIFGDLTGLLGNPTALGSGTPALPGISSIPLLGGLLSGGNLLGSIIPGLDASKIISGTLGASVLQPLIDAVSTGFGGGSGLGFSGLTSLLGGLPVATAVIDALMNGLGLVGSGFGTTDLLSTFTDLGGLLGNPTGLGTGTVGLPGISSIPLLGGLLSGGNILGSIIPGLDASKIITGSFPVSMITNLSTLLTGFGTGSSIISQLLGAVPNLASGTTGLTGLSDVFTDLFGLLGSPTNVGSTGTLTLPGITSIPLLGGLLSGSTFLGSLIPGLDASKVTSGTFLDSFIPDLGFLRGGLFSALTGSAATTADLTTAQSAMASQTEAISGQGAILAQVQAALSGETPDSDDFERSTLGSNWTFVASTGTGTIPDSHNFHYSGSGSSAEYVMRKSDIAGTSDHITSTIVLNQAIPASFISLPPYGGNVDVWVRMTAFTTFATRTGVRLRINSTSLSASYSLDWVNAGTVTNLTSGSCPMPAAGAIIQLEAGVGTSRRIVGTINGSPLVDFTDTGLVTTIGAANRYRGFGGRGTSGIGFAQGTPDIRQWTGSGSMGTNAFDTIFSYRSDADNKTVNQQNFTISAINSGYRNPTWVARYPVADVSYPDMLNNLLILAGTSGAASTGTAHTHSLANGVNNYAGAPAWALTQNQSGGSYITISNTTIMDTVGVHGRKTTATTINNLFLEVFQEYPDLSLVRIAAIDISAQATTSFAYIETALPTPIIAQAGERYMVRVRNSSTVATTFSMIGLYEETFTEAIGFNTITSTDSNKTTYTTSEAQTFALASLACYWVMLANKNVTVPTASYSDDFNRSALGSEWVTSGAGGTLAITNNEAAYGGTTDGDELGLYIRRTTTDTARVEGNLHLTPAATTQRLGLLLHANRDLSQYVYLSVTNTDAKIYSYTSATLTQRATVAIGGEALYSLTYDAVNDKYVALQDGLAFGLEWTGVSTAITHNANYRFGGIRISRGSGINAGTIDNWTLRDYA